MLEVIKCKNEFSKIIMLFIIFIALLVNGNYAFAEDEEEAQETLYFTMNKPLVVDFAKEAGMRLLQVNVSLAVKGSTDDLAELKKHEPMIRNYFLMLIRNQEPEKLRHSEGKMALQAALLKEANKMMEKVKVKTKIENVFFTSFVMQ